MLSFGAVYFLPCLTTFKKEERAFECITIADESIREVQCDYHYKYAKCIAQAELVSRNKDSGESTLTSVLELSTLFDM